MKKGKDRRKSSIAIERVGHSKREARLVITQRWYHPLAFFILGLMVFLMACIAVGRLKGNVSLALFIVVAVPVVAGTYWALTTLINSTIMTITVEMVRIRHRPLPWKPSTALKASLVDYLVMKTKEYQTEHDTVTELSLHAVLKSRSKVRLLGSLQKEEVDLLISTITDFLGLRSDPKKK